MTLYFIGVFKINRTLHGRLEVRNFSSRVQKYFSTFEGKLLVPRGHVKSSVS